MEDKIKSFWANKSREEVEKALSLSIKDSIMERIGYGKEDSKEDKDEQDSSSK